VTASRAHKKAEDGERGNEEGKSFLASLRGKCRGYRRVRGGGTRGHRKPWHGRNPWTAAENGERRRPPRFKQAFARFIAMGWAEFGVQTFSSYSKTAQILQSKFAAFPNSKNVKTLRAARYELGKQLCLLAQL
jgi:hypothetical protein